MSTLEYSGAEGKCTGPEWCLGALEEDWATMARFTVFPFESGVFFYVDKSFLRQCKDDQG